MTYAADTVRVWKLTETRYALCVEGDQIATLEKGTAGWFVLSPSVIEPYVISGPHRSKQIAIDRMLKNL